MRGKVTKQIMSNLIFLVITFLSAKHGNHVLLFSVVQSRTDVRKSRVMAILAFWDANDLRHFREQYATYTRTSSRLGSTTT